MRDTYKQLSELRDSDLMKVCEDSIAILAERGYILRKGKLHRGVIKPNITFDQYIEQDWSDLFTGSYDETPDYYVYAHVDPRKKNHLFGRFSGFGLPFYIGKGKASRYMCRRRSKPHLAQITELESIGYDLGQIAKIYKGGLTEKEALELESKLINFFGCRSEMPKLKHAYINGRKCGTLINTDTGIRPQWIDDQIASCKASTYKTYVTPNYGK